MAYSLFLSERLRQRDLEAEGPERLTPESSIVQEQGTEEVSITLFFYNRNAYPGSDNFLKGEERAIFQIEDRTLMARQIIEELFKGPSVPREPEERELESTPPVLESLYGKARLRQVYVLNDGTAVVDLTLEGAGALAGGIVTELAFIRSMVKTLRTNLPEIERVRFLLGGQPAETLLGHVSLSGAFM
jgi:hypothetical protein